MGPTRAEPRRIAFLGLGLIGGSLAMALRAAATSAELVAWTPSGRGPASARDRGIVDRVAASAPAAIAGADVVVLAGPPLATLDHVAALGGAWRGALGSHAVVTDVTSTKAVIVARADESGVRFVGGHPMAGRETVGVASGSATLFRDRPWVIVPGAVASAADVATVEWLASRTGAIPVRMAAEAHDTAAAAISHLPLVLSAALVEAVTRAGDWATTRTLAAGGWRDMTRLARGDAEMGAGILATNADAIAERLVALRAAVDAWIAALRPADGQQPDARALRARLAAVQAELAGAPDYEPEPRA